MLHYAQRLLTPTSAGLCSMFALQSGVISAIAQGCKRSATMLPCALSGLLLALCHILVAYDFVCSVLDTVYLRYVGRCHMRIRRCNWGARRQEGMIVFSAAFVNAIPPARRGCQLLIDVWCRMEGVCVLPGLHHGRPCVCSGCKCAAWRAG